MRALIWMSLLALLPASALADYACEISCTTFDETQWVQTIEATEYLANTAAWEECKGRNHGNQHNNLRDCRYDTTTGRSVATCKCDVYWTMPVAGYGPDRDVATLDAAATCQAQPGYYQWDPDPSSCRQL